MIHKPGFPRLFVHFLGIGQIIHTQEEWDRVVKTEMALVVWLWMVPLSIMIVLLLLGVLL